MALTEAEFDRIEAYLDGNLSSDEHRQMEEDLSRDSDLQQAVEEHRVIWEGLQVPVAVEYFQEMHQQLEEQGLLQFDELWVEAHESETTTSDHDEPEVFVAADPKAGPDDTTPHLEVAIHDDPELDDKPDEWDGPLDTDFPNAHYNDPDDD